MINLLPNCIAQYKLNETAAGTAVIDSMGYSNGSITGGKTAADLTQLGVIDQALLFDGDNYIDTGSGFNTVFQDSFSVNAWIKPAVTLTETIATVFGTDTRPLTLVKLQIVQQIAGPDKIKFYYQADVDGTLYVEGEHTGWITASDKPWAMITCIVTKLTAATVRLDLYLNAVLLATATGDAAMADFNTTRNLLIAAFNDPEEVTYKFEGKIDNICIFDKALSAAEISFLYNGGLGTECLYETSTLTEAEEWAIEKLIALTDSSGQPLFKNIAITDGIASRETGAEKCVDHWFEQIAGLNSGSASIERFTPFAFVIAGLAGVQREGDHDANIQIVLHIVIGQTSDIPGDARLGSGTVMGINRIFEKVVVAFDRQHPGRGLSCDEFNLTYSRISLSNPKQCVMEIEFAANWIPVF